MNKVAVLGLGLMGSEIARNLLSKGYEVDGFNRTREKGKRLVEKGLIAHATPREAVETGVDIVITILSDQDAVHDVALGTDGFLDGMKRGSLWIDMSTILPESSVEHASECERRGVERLDAPVIGGPQRAAKGELLVLVGGKRDVYDKHSSFLEQLGKLVYAGSFGAGHRMKLAFNLYLAVLATGFSEALTLAQKIGVSGRDFVDVVNMTHHKNSYTETKGPRACEKDFTPTFTLKMMRKDLALVEEEKLINGISLPVAGTVSALFTAAMNEGLSELDYSSIALMLQKMNGIN
jgi:3-hydroxyisobutyrate dehydrogenase-like beta-hydroxyacid dehydrogenase